MYLLSIRNNPLKLTYFCTPFLSTDFRYNPPAVQTDWESVPIQGTAEGAIPVTAQAHEPTGTGKSGECC